ncbi:MAG TPA: alpha/beta fold hydrolase [Aldersonia sp.]
MAVHVVRPSDLVNHVGENIGPTDWMEITQAKVNTFADATGDHLPYGFPQLAWVLGRVLDRLGIGVVDIVGISWGGAVAQQFAFRNPHRCRRLVLVALPRGRVHRHPGGHIDLVLNAREVVPQIEDFLGRPGGGSAPDET